MSNHVSIAREGRVAHITLSRPEKRNALNMEMCRELAAALNRAAADEDTGAILLTGAGPVFCAGMDLDEALQADAGALHQVHEELFTIGSRLAKPVIAAVQGAAMGGAVGLVANCHVVLAAEDARFGLTEIYLGLWPFVIFRSVADAAGERRALEWSVSGRIFGAREAWQAGLVHRVVPAGELAARAEEAAAETAGYSPAAIRLGLAFTAAARGKSQEEIGRMARAARAEVMRGPDFEEGVRAFREKRAPEFYHKSMSPNLTPGLYVTRSAKYEVRPDGTIWIVGGEELPEGAPRRQVNELPPDAVMTHAAGGGPIDAGTTPPGKRWER